jgi:hypothetical protein
MAETKEEEKRRDDIVRWLKNRRRPERPNVLRTANEAKKG